MELIFHNTYRTVVAAHASSFCLMISMVVDIKAMVTEAKLA